jgi:hypothetical protein
MVQLVWDEVGQRRFEDGVDRGVLYPPGSAPVPWSGLVSVVENASGGEIEELFLDGMKYLDLPLSENFQATIEAFTYPPEFEILLGRKEIAAGLFATRQRKRSFGLSYRTLIGTDTNQDHGYKIHLVYNATVGAMSTSRRTRGGTPSPTNFQWPIYARPDYNENFKSTAHFVIDSTLVDPVSLASVENALYGTADTAPYLPTIDQVIFLMQTGPGGETLTIIDNGDGTWSATGADGVVDVTGDEFDVTSTSIVVFSDDLYYVESQ